MPDVAAVILNYGDPTDAIRLTDALLDAPGIGAIVLVDNFSTDANSGRLATYAASRDQRIGFVALPSNRGYAAGNNAGLRHAFEALGVDFALVLNPDIDLLPGFNASLADLLADTELLFTGSVDQHDRRYGLLEFRPRSGRSRDIATRDPSRPCYASGCCFGFSRGMWQGFGGFAEDYFLQFEELDFIYRYQRDRGRFPNVAVVPSIRVRHREGGTTGSAPGRSSPFNDYWSARSRAFFYRRLLGRLTPVAIGYNLVKATACLLRGRWGSATAIIRGTRDGLHA